MGAWGCFEGCGILVIWAFYESLLLVSEVFKGRSPL